MLFLINPLFLISFCQKPVDLQGALRTEVIVWDRLGSPLVNILFMTKLPSLAPLFLRYGLSPDLVTIIIPCSLGNGYCTFGFLIFIIHKRNFLYYSLYILTEKSLKHLCSIRAWVPVSLFLSFSFSLFLSISPSLRLSLSLSYRRLWTARSQSIKGPQQSNSHIGTWLLEKPTVQFSCSVMSDSLWSNGLQHTRFLCPSPPPP